MFVAVDAADPTHRKFEHGKLLSQQRKDSGKKGTVGWAHAVPRVQPSRFNFEALYRMLSSTSM
jgi:hypothetical protein